RDGLDIVALVNGIQDGMQHLAAPVLRIVQFETKTRLADDGSGQRILEAQSHLPRLLARNALQLDNLPCGLAGRDNLDAAWLRTAALWHPADTDGCRH